MFNTKVGHQASPSLALSINSNNAIYQLTMRPLVTSTGPCFPPFSAESFGFQTARIDSPPRVKTGFPAHLWGMFPEGEEVQRPRANFAAVETEKEELSMTI
jgi:hypothetical protein